MQAKTVVADFEEWREAAAEAVEVLKNGELVALPTETVYGLAADVTNADAVAKIFEVKERPHFDPLIVHIGKMPQLTEVVSIPEALQPLVQQLADEFWPGPLTLILPKTEKVPDLVTSGLDTVAVRMSAHEVMREVAKTVPVAAPSANRFGRISPTSATAVATELGEKIPLIIDGGACRDGIESTIVRPELDGNKPVLRLLRPGPITKEDLRKFAKVLKPKGTKSDHAEAPSDAETTASGLPAPGLLDSHYAPATPLRLIDKDETFEPEEGKSYALLSYRAEGRGSLVDATDWKAIEVLSPGKGKLTEAGVRLFHCLRNLDESGADEIIAEPVSETGIGIAIMDRLRKAAH